MIVEINSNTFSVVWRYNNDAPTRKSRALGTVRETKCIIRNGIGKESTPISEANAYQDPRDKRDDNTARKLTLQRALDELTFDKETKKAFWTAYKEMRNGKF